MVFDPQALRRDYKLGSLDAATVELDPFAQFHVWLQQAITADLIEANAMAVATVSPDGSPSIRTVLLKQVDARGFVFNTSTASAKGIAIAANPRVSLLFYWAALERQVRIEGVAAALDAAEADAWFASRPLLSRVSAAVSPQSQVIPDRDWLQERTDAMLASLPEGEGPARPADWGGYRVTPHQFEFWQGRPNRLHDRIRYLRKGSQWAIDRLAP